MKIEWLNDQFTRAKITCGWFRKRFAVVRCVGHRTWAFERADGSIEGRMQTTGMLDEDLSDARDKAEIKAVRNNVWSPVPKLPKARLLKG